MSNSEIENSEILNQLYEIKKDIVKSIHNGEHNNVDYMKGLSDGLEIAISKIETYNNHIPF